MPRKLKPIIEKLTDVLAPERDFYHARSDGKWELELDGEPSAVAEIKAKLSEFRDTNRSLNRKVVDLEEALKARPDATKIADLEAQLKAFEGIDPAEFKALKARPDLTAKVTELEGQLATANGAKADAQLIADDAVFKSTIGAAFIAAGGEPAALDLMLLKAKDAFTVKDGQVKTTEFSVSHPGEPLTPLEWCSLRVLDTSFAFKPSSGGGALGGGRRTQAGPTVISRSDHDAFSKNLEAIAKGTVVLGD